jgi:hypothetical protein
VTQYDTNTGELCTENERETENEVITLNKKRKKMKTQVITPATRTNGLRTLWNAFLASQVMTTLAAWFSQMMEEEVSPQQALRMVHAQLAFAALVLLGGQGPLVAVLLFAWFALSVWQCVR